MKKVICILFLIIAASASFSQTMLEKTIKNWGLSASSGGFNNETIILTFTDNPTAIYSFDQSLLNSADKLKILTALLTSIKANGGEIKVEFGTVYPSSGLIVSIWDNN